MTRRLSLLPALITVSALLSPLTASPAFSSQCNYSYWVWLGGERVKVCCNQYDFCLTKYGIYQQ